MNRERLFKHLEDHYIPKREMISRIPLGVQPDEFWQDVQNRRRARSISLQLHNPRGIPYWYVVTNKMIAASERIVDEMMEIYDVERAECEKETKSFLTQLIDAGLAFTEEK